MVVILAVGTSVPLEEVPVSQLLPALAADVVLRMPHLREGNHHLRLLPRLLPCLPDDGFPALGAVALGNGGDAVAGGELGVHGVAVYQRLRLRRVPRRRTALRELFEVKKKKLTRSWKEPFGAPRLRLELKDSNG